MPRHTGKRLKCSGFLDGPFSLLAKRPSVKKGFASVTIEAILYLSQKHEFGTGIMMHKIQIILNFQFSTQ